MLTLLLPRPPPPSPLVLYHPVLCTMCCQVWDYQTKACVQTLDGHAHNISAVAFHPELPIILSASEDGCIKVWHATTYRLENTLNYGMERIWAIGVIKGSNSVAFGFDEGVTVVKIGAHIAKHQAHARVCATYTLMCTKRHMCMTHDTWR